MAAPEVKLKKLSDFQPQRENSNKHTARGLWMLDSAMAQDGYVAPMTATADGEVIDGSARLEKAVERFPDDAIVVEHDGRRPIVMVRTDIPSADDPRAQRISAAANRIAQVNLDFDPAVLAQLSQKMDLSPLWTKEELQAQIEKGEAALVEVTPPEGFASYDENIDTQFQCPKCHFEWSGKPK